MKVTVYPADRGDPPLLLSGIGKVFEIGHLPDELLFEDNDPAAETWPVVRYNPHNVMAVYVHDQ